MDTKYYKEITEEAEEKFSKLVELIESEDTSALKDYFIKNPSDINLTDCINRSFLIKAVRKDNADAVKLLLELGADPNICQIDSDISPLESAVIREHLEIAELLLRFGSDPNHIGLYSMPALYHCLSRYNPDMIELLIKYKANPNILLPSGTKTLLELAESYPQGFVEYTKNKQKIMEIIDKYASSQ